MDIAQYTEDITKMGVPGLINERQVLKAELRAAELNFQKAMRDTRAKLAIVKGLLDAHDISKAQFVSVSEG